MKRKLARALPVTAVVGGITCAIAGLGTVTAGSAAAATPTCDGTGIHAAGNYSVAYIPHYRGGGGTWNCQLAEGSSGKAVTSLQTALKRCYGADISVDGQFGPRTKSALKSAQRTAGAGSDGIYGPETREKLKWPSQMQDTDKGCNRLT
ncbi:peptidoglycan-binding protein [Nocardia sp. NPDC127579]|uniref:peptidoglycan-binding domain-containing protein n=1 Tax=Nocardia sp. NPDC127579 TaxID=3345402 RepID=UPI0036421267